MRQILFRRTLIVSALLIGILVLVRCCVVYVRPQTALLPDGTVLTLESWDYGRHHRLVRHGRLWWQAFLPPQVISSFDTDDPILALWIRKKSVANPSPQKVVPGASWWDWAEIVDERGQGVRTWRGDISSPHNENILERVTGVSPTSGDQPYNFPLPVPLNYDGECLLLRVFPRRGKELHIRFFSLQAAHPLAEFTLPNPTPGPHPMWKPEPLPIVRQDGSLTFSLQTVKNQIRIDSPDSHYRMAPFDPVRDFKRPMRTEEWRTLTTLYTVTEHGVPTRDWQPRRMVLLDATGNRLELPAAFAPEGLTEKNFAPQLDGVGLFCIGESAHRLRVEFVRSPFAHFGPEDLWTVRNLAVPSNTGITLSAARCTREGVTFELQGLSGKNYRSIRPLGNWLQSVDSPTLNVRLSPPRNDMQVYLRATDAKGRPLGYNELGLTGVNYSWQPPDTFQMFGPESSLGTFVSHACLYNASAPPADNIINFNLKIPSGVKSINLTFAISRSRWIEFTPNLLHP